MSLTPALASDYAGENRKSNAVVFRKMLLSNKGNSAVSVTKIRKEQNNEKK